MVGQRTLKNSIRATGVGLHTGKKVLMTLKPAAPDTGIVFRRTDLPTPNEVPARAENVGETMLGTTLVKGDVRVSTVEHLLSAFAGLGIDNAVVEVSSPEVPIMDGSAEAFVEAIRETGLVNLSAARRYVRVLRPVSASKGHACSELLPHDEDGLHFDVSIDFDSSVIGRQRRVLELDPDSFAAEVSRARTFGFMRDVELLWKNGFALGASLENTVAIGDERVINPEGLRYEDEFVRHKLLDAVGDIAMAGLPIIGLFRSHCGGHRLNIAVLRELFSDPANFEIVEAKDVVPSRRVQMAAAAYAPSLG